MKRTATFYRVIFTTLAIGILLINNGCMQLNRGDGHSAFKTETEEDEYDNPDAANAYWKKRMKDPALGEIPRGRMRAAFLAAMESKINAPLSTSSFGTWVERGPNLDVSGPSGNSRPNGDVTAGRIRSIMVDAADATGNTVFLGSVGGGLWKTTNITSAPPTWTLVNDFFSNMCISGICQDPTNTSIMYFCTGESYFNADAEAGDGIFKSTNGGATWTQLSSTTSSTYDYCSRILCDGSGNVYVATRSGVFRSTNGGTSWTTITPSGLATSRFSDMELSNTGRLHVSAGQFSTCAYRFTDNPSTVTAATWTAPTAGFPASTVRIELGVLGNTVYALPSDAGYQVPTIYKSTDGGANWAATTGQPTSGWASQQAWYSLNCVLDPSNINTVIVGGLDNYKSTDGGATWTKISTWVGFSGQYVHADNHVAVWYDGGNKLLFGSDGGIFYSSDKGVTIRDRNTGLRIKQFYACAINPTGTSNILLAGAQDNGSHMLNSPGLGSSTEVTGGDGAFVHIDQNQPQYMFTSYVYNQYRRNASTGSGSWTSINFSTTLGQFINPTDYDDINNIMYCGYSAGNYKRWTNPQTGSTSANINITALGSNSISCVTVSPYTNDRVYFGTENDFGASKLCYVDNASTIASGSTGTDISTGLPTNVYTSCVAAGTDDNNLMVCYSNYGVQQVWVSTNGGTSWTNIDGNLPDMPVYWCMFVPGTNGQAILGTEAGLWFTSAISAGTTVWQASPTFPTVRTTMLQLKPDNTLLASTYGRGLWTQNVFSAIPVNNFVLRGKWAGSNSVELNWEYPASTAGAAKLDIESSPDGLNFTKIGSMPQQSSGTYKFTYAPPAGSPNLFYRIKSNEITGAVKFSNTVKLFRNGNDGKLEIIKLYPNPAQNNLGVAFNIATKGTGVFTLNGINGQTIWRKEEDLQFSGNYIRNWDISNVKPGTYVFTISCNGQKVSQQLVKQ